MCNNHANITSTSKSSPKLLSAFYFLPEIEDGITRTLWTYSILKGAEFNPSLGVCAFGETTTEAR